ncbi:MAG: hypothetical protein M2R45_03861 [Verrucomicrobia subdivision 3 bacterium]|nr:hypothetical protein [Limisphaerales bacterium]MCS1415816.1 hypothetical protein [Limisphaerales bacterium]
MLFACSRRTLKGSAESRALWECGKPSLALSTANPRVHHLVLHGTLPADQRVGIPSKGAQCLLPFTRWPIGCGKMIRSLPPGGPNPSAAITGGADIRCADSGVQALA